MTTAARPDITEASIVLLGNFNPKIFQPAWFAAHQLIASEEASVADVKVIHPQVCHFETESTQIQVTADRFLAMTRASAPWMPLRDLVVGTFSILEHTPVAAMGMNRHMHFSTASKEAWHKIGDALAPKDGWNAVLGGRPGLLALTILGERQDRPGVPLRVEIQGSTRVQNGVLVQTNEHHAFVEIDGLKGLVRTLYDEWESAQKHAEHVASSIIDWSSR